MGQYMQAIPLLKRHLAVYPDHVWGHVSLVVAYVELGRHADARTEAAEVSRISPRFTMGNVNKDESVNRRWEADLREAGVK